jgi:hypothetical protein
LGLTRASMTRRRGGNLTADFVENYHGLPGQAQ